MIEKFRNYLKNERKLKNSTISCYIGDIKLLDKMLSQRQISEYNELDQLVFSQILFALETENRSKASIIRFISSVKVFYTFLVMQGVCTGNVIRECEYAVKVPPMPQTEFLTDMEITRLFAQPDTTVFKGLRDRVLLEFCYALTLRVSELLSLNVADVNVLTSTILCRSGKEMRYITLYPSLNAILSEYITVYSKMYGAMKPMAPLFVNRQFERLTRQGLWKIIKEYSSAAKIEKEVSPLMLRRSFASHLISKGADAEDIKKVFNYRSLASAKALARK